MNRWILVVCVFILSLTAVKTNAQTVSSEGTDFWAVFPTHVPSNSNNGPQLAELSVFVTAKANTRVTVSCGTYSSSQDIAPNTAVEFKIPRAQAYIDLIDANKALGNRGIHVKVADGMPSVSAYAHIYAGARSAASLILPFETMGQQYYSMNYTQGNFGDNFMVLMAVEDDTKIRVHPKSGPEFTIDLPKAGDVYQYMNRGDDLTGVFTEIDPSTPCKKFAVFSGSTMIDIGDCPTPPNHSYDPLYQQLYPVNSWGKNYGVVPFAERNYILRIMAQDDNTSVTFNGTTKVIGKGQFIETGKLTDAIYISADKVISVAQFSLTQSCSGAFGQSLIGDPEMVMLNPIEFSIKGITVFSSTKQNISENARYINVLIRKAAAQSFRINGNQPAVTWQPLTDNPLFVYAQLPVFAESLTLTASDGFNAIAYGFGDHESYAYSAGTNLSSNNYLTVVNKNNGNTESADGCIGDQLDFKINLPYPVDRLIWTLDNRPPIILTFPQAEIKVAGNEVTYVYSLPADLAFPEVGEHRIEVRSSISANTNSCITGEVTTGYVFNIYEHPIADFETELATGCVGQAFAFKDKSNPNAEDFTITEWRWDFNDPSSPANLSTEQNPAHIFSNPGEYLVKLSVKAGTGCFSDVYEKKIVVYPVPQTGFIAAKALTCINTSIKFEDRSTISSGANIVKWIWSFGDGSADIEKTDPSPVLHSFEKQGIYEVRLTAVSDHDCAITSDITSITVTALPVVDFDMPDVCLEDAVAVFTNKSLNVDQTENGLSYEWRFADGDPALPANRSILKNGRHQFSVAGNYQVTLIVRNSNGCEVSVQKTFTVNGGVEKADFTVKNLTSLCSKAPVLINNTSSVFFGKITKIEIYKDFLGKPSEFITVQYPTGADIPLNYEDFGGNSSRDFTIRLVAYSGTACFKEVSKVITVNPSPQLFFDNLLPVCENEGTISVAKASETSGMQMASGIYSGPYVSSNGSFNAKLAKAGIHQVTYTFTGLNGCPASITKSITVLRSPVADAGPTVYILSGMSTKINATATTGAGVTYKWSPALGLDRDNVLNPIATPQKDTKYTLTVYTIDGCPATTEVWVRVLQEIKPPSAFSPNGDGVNDNWQIPYLTDYPDPTVQVFNRSGEIVFFSRGYSLPFDGNYKGEVLPVGVYYYIINPNYTGRKRITGSLTIIR
ncbi:gliding motility-associated C-terminal domain-containing protein [Pedobacter sp. GR22-6]|uniref:gliding motility-associated C-terminal domain-containing protein n=1 Tax=Pedobacter sp. GR22-6 TaxID=3127957 RepID=UPI00307E9C17